MVKLDPSADFQANLELLLATVADSDLQSLLRENADKISALSSSSTEITRQPIIHELNELIRDRGKADGGDE